MSIVFFLCVDLALKRGFRDINGQVIALEFGYVWKLTINGKREHHGHIPPLNVLVERNGLPVTLLGPVGGGPIIGFEEDELIAALKRAGAELPPDVPAVPTEPQPQQKLPGIE